MKIKKGDVVQTSYSYSHDLGAQRAFEGVVIKDNGKTVLVHTGDRDNVTIDKAWLIKTGTKEEICTKCGQDTDWNDGYWLEAMDRCHTISTMIDELLRGHPAVLRTPDGADMVEKAIGAVQKLYNSVGAAEDNEN